MNPQKIAKDVKNWPNCKILHKSGHTACSEEQFKYFTTN